MTPLSFVKPIEWMLQISKSYSIFFWRLFRSQY